MNKIETILNEWRNNNKGIIKADVEIHELLYGKDSCFLLAKNYKSHAYDDYCDFTYYSNITGERFEDHWATAFACPNYDRYICKSFGEAEKEDLINIELYNTNWKCDLSHLKNCKFYYDYENHNPIVEVIRGRKVKKGTKGIYIMTELVPGYMGEIYQAVLYTTDGEIVKVNPSYLKYEENFQNKLYEYLTGKLEEEMQVTDRIRKFDTKKNIEDFYYLEGNLTMLKIAVEELNKFNEAEEIRKYAPSEKFMVWLKNHFPNLSEEELFRKGIDINKKNGNVNR